jgi:hypothetical protein
MWPKGAEKKQDQGLDKSRTMMLILLLWEEINLDRQLILIIPIDAF